MLPYQITSILSILLSGFLLGVVVMLIGIIRSHKDELALKIREFADVTANASKANVSMGEAFSGIDVRIVSLEDRISMLSSGMGATQWPNQSKKN